MNEEVKYEFKNIRNVTFIQFPDEYELLANVFGDRNYHELKFEVIPDIEDVLQGKKEMNDSYSALHGIAYIYKDRTIVKLSEFDEGTYDARPCEIPTIQLYKILKEYTIFLEGIRNNKI